MVCGCHGDQGPDLMHDQSSDSDAAWSVRVDAPNLQCIGMLYMADFDASCPCPAQASMAHMYQKEDTAPARPCKRPMSIANIASSDLDASSDKLLFFGFI